MRYPIPAASARAWERHKGLSPQNPGLIFDRFVQDWGWRKQQFQDKEAKKKAWLEVVGIAPHADKELLAAWNARWEHTTRAANAKPFPLRTDWRFVAGLGRKGPLEVGFTFHRYGFPILPGSSVKGVARAWAFFEIAKKSNTTDLKQLEEALSADDEKRRKYEEWRVKVLPEVGAEADNFREIFGTTAGAGCAVFFDAIPAATRLPELQLDIMNPHYPDYYGGNEFPTDWQSPIPVFFLTVAPGMEFRFAVGWRGTLNAALRQKAEKWLKEGLMNLGAGAKTSAGYGYFQPPEVAAPTSQRVVVIGEVAPPAPTVAPVQTRRGEIVEIDTSGRQSGRVRDLESGELYGFSTCVIEGNTPGRKAQVIFDLRDGKVIRVKRG